MLLFRALLVLLAFAMAAPVARAAGCSDPPARIQAGYRMMYDLDFASAHREFAQWKS